MPNKNNNLKEKPFLIGRDLMSWMAGNHVPANLLMIVLLVFGFISQKGIKKEVFPDFEIDRVTVSFSYPGASPAEIEESIAVKVEEAIQGISDIKKISTNVAEGSVNVTAEILSGANINRVLSDIKTSVDRIPSLPKDVEKPVISSQAHSKEVMDLILYGKGTRLELKQNAEFLRDEFLALPEISQVNMAGSPDYEIAIEVPEAHLLKYKLSLGRISQIVSKASLDLPGGEIKREGRSILIRTKEKRYKAKDFKKIVLISDAGGGTVTLGDIAKIKDGFDESGIYTEYNGKEAAVFKVSRVGDQDPIQISTAVKKFLSQVKLPPSYEVEILKDRSIHLKGRIDLLLKNAYTGLILVFIILGLFLRLKVAFWVAVGIPISFAGSFLVMPLFGVTINLISLFAFILVLGIVVDDAIIAGENIYAHRKMGKSPLQAARDGIFEISGPIIFSILTTIAAFSPLMFIPGIMGKFFFEIPLIVISVLAISLVEALFILPSHMCSVGTKESYFETKRQVIERALENFIQVRFKGIVKSCISRRYLTLSCCSFLLIFFLGLVAGKRINFIFLPKIDRNHIKASLKMPLGTDLEETAKVISFIKEKGQNLMVQYNKKAPNNPVKGVLSSKGSQLPKGGHMNRKPAKGSHLAEVKVYLKGSEERKFSSIEFARAWRKEVGEVPGISSLKFSASGFSTGADVDAQLAHKDIKVLQNAAAAMKKRLAVFSGVSDISTSQGESKSEIKISLNRVGKSLGLIEEDVARQVRYAYFGSRALRLQRSRDLVDVYVRLPLEERNSIYSLKNLKITGPSGQELILGEVANFNLGKSYGSIQRVDRKRVLSVTADVDEKVNSAHEVVQIFKRKVVDELKADFPGLGVSFEGRNKERSDSLRAMFKGFLYAMLAIYILLAIPFKSYFQPLIVMSAIPFGIIGAVLGHLILGFDLSIMSLMGIVSLSGVVVNDSLIMIDFINRRKNEGMDIFNSVIDASTRRFRPILLTSLTTFFGLLPMIFETSLQAQFLIPMAVSLAFGVVFATVIILILVPSSYLILDDIRKLFAGEKNKEEVATPAAEAPSN